MRRALFLALALIVPPPSAWAQAPAKEQVPQTGVAAEIRSMAGGRLRDFYGPRGYWPIWIDKAVVGPQADALIGLLASADLDGLRPRDYDVRDLHKLIDTADRSGDPKLLARVEVALSNALAAYVTDMRKPARGVSMRYLDPELEPRALDSIDILRGASLAPSLIDYIKTAGWMSPFYMQLRGARAIYGEQWGDLPTIELPVDGKFRPGMKGGDVPRLRHRLGLTDGNVYDRPLAARVRAFQAAHGLTADGVAGGRTIAALNRGPAYYDRLLALNLERARLLPGPWVRHVVVDAASARLYYYGGGSLDGTMKVVVGARESQTPMLAGMIRFATLNPYWNIPADLVQHNVAPKILGGASLQRLHYEVLSDWSATPAKLEQASIDWQAIAAGREEVRVRQLPGGDNAMGRVKFMFPNDLGIYLHDTPQRDLFARSARHYSNGCVRLEDAQRLGRWFFGKPLAAKGDAPEEHQALPAPVPVYLTYLTAAPTGSGVQFLTDVYGQDGE